MTETTENKKWIKLVNEFGNTAEVPERDVALWEKDGWKRVED